MCSTSGSVRSLSSLLLAPNAEFTFAEQTKLAEGGYLYKSTHAGYYSITDECFYTPAQITTRPGPGGEVLVAQETGSAVEWAEEENWKFRLSAFREQLIAHLEANPTCTLSLFLSLIRMILIIRF